MIHAAQHALYRFFDGADVLLYVGITRNPARRWERHADEKPWWIEVARITIEPHPDRDSVVKAEAEAIRTERPRYNVKHNGTSPGAPSPKAAARLAPFNAGDVVALGLEDGKCPIGLIDAIDEEWIRIDLMSFATGHFGFETLVIRRDEVKRAMTANVRDPEDVRDDGYSDWKTTKYFDTAPLGMFQSEWKAAHGDESARQYLEDVRSGKFRPGTLALP